jgi:hypothetical protein
MAPTKTLRQREKELQALMATPAGRQELHELEQRYQAAGRQELRHPKICVAPRSRRALFISREIIQGPVVTPRVTF